MKMSLLQFGVARACSFSTAVKNTRSSWVRSTVDTLFRLILATIFSTTVDKVHLRCTGRAREKYNTESEEEYTSHVIELCEKGVSEE